MGVPVRDAAVVFIAIPPVRPCTTYPTVSLEFVNTDGLGKVGWSAEVDELKDRLDSALRDLVSSCDFREIKYLDAFNGCFQRQFCQITTYFHSCFSTSFKTYYWFKKIITKRN